MEQQRDALNLRLPQSSGEPSYDFSASDARKLEQLHIQQLMEQQRLDLEQVQRYHALRARSDASQPFDRRIDLQRELFSIERQLQNQQFDLDRHRIVQSLQRLPLQPPMGTGQLRLP